MLSIYTCEVICCSLYRQIYSFNLRSLIVRNKTWETNTWETTNWEQAFSSLRNSHWLLLLLTANSLAMQDYWHLAQWSLPPEQAPLWGHIEEYSYSPVPLANSFDNPSHHLTIYRLTCPQGGLWFVCDL